MSYPELHARSLADPDAFWRAEARRIEWHRPFETVCDQSRLPSVRWFVGGETNLCHNAVDRHLASQADQPALIWVSTEVDQEKSFTFGQLHREVQRMAAIFLAHGVGRGDRVLIYLPMIPEAVFAMLACARIGAIHSVVFGGFASHALASRIDDGAPKLVVSADAGARGGRMIPYKGLLDEAISLARCKPEHVLMVDLGRVPFDPIPGRDLDYATERERVLDAQVPVTWLESNEISYILYTSGTTGKPKGVQRDVGGYAVALAHSMANVFQGEPGQTYFSTSDIGWVVGHSYTVYGPLLAGMATILYEGLPTRPDGAIFWKLVEQYRVSAMFSSPTGIRVLKKQDPDLLKRHDVSSLKGLYLAGEPLDESTSSWISEALGVPIIDNYWQTESGWPILTIARGLDDRPARLGSPGFAMPGFDVRIVDEVTGLEVPAGQKGVVAIVPPLPPGCMQSVWGDEARFLETYYRAIPGREVYSTFDWGIVDEDGYTFILGRTDDVINVAGHRLGTREIEESISSHKAVAECAVVGVADALKGQAAVAVVVLKDSAVLTAEDRARLSAEVMATVDRQLGAIARPAKVYFVGLLPKTRSGKVLRRAILAVCEGRDPGELTTIEDPSALDQLRQLVGTGNA